ncbi:hypothetical protein [Nonomuraea sp. NPDC050310]|uniref:hypothetical protein n=1 Tax=Nonomuraea sp. NPDC050310 TaxID=3154935 RepID=UPI0033C21C4C
MTAEPPPQKVTVKNTGDAYADRGGIAVSGAAHIYQSPPPRPARSAYPFQVKQLFPGELIGREAELAELARFCTAPEGPSYAWWQGPAWAGKSALMAWFVQHPPAGVKIVSFFVTARLPGNSDRAGFLPVVVEQLAELAGEPMPAPLSEAMWVGQLNQALDEAAAACSQSGHRLVLVVDGLDEDRGVTAGADAYSIAALLPASLPPGVRVVVAGRPSPPVPQDVPAWHPLRDPGIVRPLSTSAEARAVRDDAERELWRLLDTDGPEHDLVGLVATAGGGLSSRDLAELADLSEPVVRRRLRAVAGRTFQSRTGRWVPAEVYTLAHEELQQAALANLSAAEQARYRELLHAWADRHRELGWPEGTPEYLLRGYFRLLHSQGDLPRMVTYATDGARLDRMLDVSGGDAVAYADLALAQSFVCAQEDPDVAAALDLAAARRRLYGRSAGLPPRLPLIWAAAGHLTRAETLARSLIPMHQYDDPVRQAYGELSEALAESGDLGTAEEFAWRERRAGPELIKALVAAGAYERAEALVATPFGALRHLRLALGEAFLAAGELDRAGAALRSIADRDPDAPASALLVDEGGLAMPALTGLARALRAAGRAEEARELARWAAAYLTTRPEDQIREEESAERIGLLADLAEALLAGGEPEQARRLAGRIEALGRGAYLRISALARLLPLQHALGDAEEVARIRFEAAETYADGFLYAWVAPALNQLMRALIGLGDPAGARRLIAPALEGALANLREGDPMRGPGPLLDLMRVLADLGENERLRDLPALVEEPAHLDEVRIVLAEIHLANGEYAEACAAGRAVAGARRRDDALHWLTYRLIDEAEPGLAESVFRELADPARRGDALLPLAKALVSAGAADRAAALLEPEPPGVRVALLLDLAKQIPEEHRRAWAERALAVLEESAEQWDEAALLAARAEALVHAGDTEAARRTAEQAEDLLAASEGSPWARGVDTATLMPVWHALGEPDRAAACGRLAGELGDALDHPAERGDLFETLAGVLDQLGLAEEAAAVAAKIPDPGTRSATLSRLYGEAVLSGIDERVIAVTQPAFDAAYDIPDPREQTAALAGLAARMRDAGWLGDAAVVANAIGGAADRARALIGIMGPMAEADDPEAFQALAEAAESAAGSILDPEVLARAEIRTALLWAAAGDRDEALAHAGPAFWTTGLVAGLWDRLWLTTDLARVHHELGDPEAARACAEEVEGFALAYLRADLLLGLQSSVAQAWLAAGLPDRAEASLRILAEAVSAAAGEPGGEGTQDTAGEAAGHAADPVATDVAADVDGGMDGGMDGDADTDADEGVDADVVDDLVGAFVAAGEWARAERIASLFPESEGRSAAREDLALGWLSAGEPDRAAEIVPPHSLAAVKIARALAAAEKPPPRIEPTPTPHTAIPGSAIPGSAIPGSAVPSGAVPGGALTVGAVAGGAVAGSPVPGGGVPGGARVGGARALAERAEAAAQRMSNDAPYSGLQPRAEALIWSVRVWAAAGDLDHAARLARTVESALLARLTTGGGDPAAIHTFYALIRVGALERAERLAETGIVGDTDRIQALTMLAQAHAAAGDFARARTFAEAAETTFEQLRTEPGGHWSAMPPPVRASIEQMVRGWLALASAAATTSTPSSATTASIPSSAATASIPSSAATASIPSSAATASIPSSAATASAATPATASANPPASATPATGPAIPTTAPAIPTTGPAIPTTGPAIPATGPAIPTTDPATPTTADGDRLPELAPAEDRRGDRACGDKDLAGGVGAGGDRDGSGEGGEESGPGPLGAGLEAVVGELAPAVAVAAAVLDEGRRVRARARSVEELLDDGDLVGAEALVLGMAADEQAVHLVRLLEGWAGAGERERARAVGEAAFDSGTEVRRWLVNEAMDAGDQARARALAERVAGGTGETAWESAPDALQELFETWLRVGDLERAEAVARGRYGRDAVVPALCELAVARRQRGEAAAALGLLAEVAALVDALPYGRSRDEARRSLAGAWASVGDFGKAQAVAEAMDGPPERASALAELARKAPAPLSARLLCLALAQHADHTGLLHVVTDLAPEALHAARHL